MFDYLALGAIVDGRVFCVHGGLSPNLQSIDQVRLFLFLVLDSYAATFQFLLTQWLVF